MKVFERDKDRDKVNSEPKMRLQDRKMSLCVIVGKREISVCVRACVRACVCVCVCVSEDDKGKLLKD